MCDGIFSKLISILSVFLLCFLVSGCSGEAYSENPSDYYVECDFCHNTLCFTYGYDSEDGTYFYCYDGYGDIAAGTDCPVCAYNYGGYHLYDMVHSELSGECVDSSVIFDPSEVYVFLCEEFGDDYADYIFDGMYAASAIHLDDFYDPNNYRFIR